MRDDIMRLAERVESIFSDVPLSRMEQETKAIADDLRALARTDHVEDKLGVVPEALKYPDENKFRMIDVFRQEHNFARGWNACRDAMLAASPAPDHPACVGGMVVDDAAVERVAKAVADDWQRERAEIVPWERLTDKQKELARCQVRIVTAALARPADADADGAR